MKEWVRMGKGEMGVWRCGGKGGPMGLGMAVGVCGG